MSAFFANCDEISPLSKRLRHFLKASPHHDVISFLEIHSTRVVFTSVSPHETHTICIDRDWLPFGRFELYISVHGSSFSDATVGISRASEPAPSLSIGQLRLWMQPQYPNWLVNEWRLLYRGRGQETNAITYRRE